MNLLSLPDNTPRRLVFYLAMEEYAARHLGSLLAGGGKKSGCSVEDRKGSRTEDVSVEKGSLRGKVWDGSAEEGFRVDGPLGGEGGTDHIKTHVPAGLQRGLFFTWRTAPTVIFGRNQVLEAEVNTAYCREHGVEMYRRKSGGGCVYSDSGNIMLSYITPSEGVAFTFDKFLNLLSLALRRLGLDAQRSGRNDILIGGRKVSGNAFYLLPGAGIVHGTLLFDSDLDAMTQAITPSKAKIESKGVPSVRSHVTNLKDELEAIGRPMNLEDFRKYLADFFTGGKNSLSGTGENSVKGSREITLSDSRIRAIEEIEKGYLAPEFISGRRHGYTIRREDRVPGVGQLSVELAMEGDRIVSCSICGDYFPLKEGAEEEISARLQGCPKEKEAAAKALQGVLLENYIMNLDTAAFLDLAFREGE